MRDRIITIAGVLFIAACALIIYARISSHYSAPDAPVLPASWTPSPLVPVTTSAAAAASPVPTTARPRRTVTVTVTTTLPPRPASTAGEDGP